jgi:N-acetylglucosaminyldiphosphoundecaprenol N-acetyl-beta-D-mannosaminyltransferase
MQELVASPLAHEVQGITVQNGMIDAYSGAVTSAPLRTTGEDGWSVWDRLFAKSLSEGRSALRRRLSAGTTRSTTAVAFLNMHNYVVCQDAARSVFAHFDFLFADGVGLQIAKLLVPAPPFHRVSGSDLVPALLNDRQCPPLRVFLLGGERTFIAQTAARFPDLFPRHQLVGYYHGYIALSEDAHLVDVINACQPDLLLIGMGTPYQELWLAEHRHRVKTRVAICVGGLFRYWHGGLKRAPRLLRQVGLEWLWILVQQPGKWRRYMIGPWQLLRVLVRTRRGLRPWS